MLVQSLRMLGAEPMDGEIKTVLKRRFDQKQWAKIRIDAVGVSNRIYGQICELAQWEDDMNSYDGVLESAPHG